MEVRETYDYVTCTYTWPFSPSEIVAEVDESASYEIDQTRIEYAVETDKFWLLTATGCSCWDGVWYAEEFDNLDTLFASLIDERSDERQYNPSGAGVIDLREQASRWVTSKA